MANFPEISGLMDCSNIKLTEIFVPKYSFILALKSVLCIYNHRTTKTNQKYPSVNL